MTRYATLIERFGPLIETKVIPEVAMMKPVGFQGLIAFILKWSWIVTAAVTLVQQTVCAREMLTNSLQVIDAPSWLTEKQLETSTRRIENFLEWDLHRIKAYFHSTKTEFDSIHDFSFAASAFFRRADGTIHLGPTVTKESFDGIFGHEMVHAIFFQKYKGAIPPWLEEGLANYIGMIGHPDYKWLATQDLGDITKLAHPNIDPRGSKFHYMLSTATMEMIASKCSLKDLLQLSVGRKLTSYLATYCEIKDLNSDLKSWVKVKAAK